MAYVIDSIILHVPTVVCKRTFEISRVNAVTAEISVSAARRFKYFPLLFIHMGSDKSLQQRVAEEWLDLDEEQELLSLKRTERKEKFVLKGEGRPRTSCDPVIIVEQEPNRLIIKE